MIFFCSVIIVVRFAVLFLVKKGLKMGHIVKFKWVKALKKCTSNTQFKFKKNYDVGFVEKFVKLQILIKDVNI